MASDLLYRWTIEIGTVYCRLPHALWGGSADVVAENESTANLTEWTETNEALDAKDRHYP